MTAFRRPRFLGNSPDAGITAARFDPLKSSHDALEDGHARAPGASGSAPPPSALPPPVPIAPRGTGLDPRVAMAVESLRTASQRLAEQARMDALEIGLLVARRILEREIETDPRHLVTLIRDALTRLGEARVVTVRLNDGDLEKLGALPPEAFVGTARVRVVADSDLSTGDCVVEGDAGSVEYRLQERLDEAGRLLRASTETGAA